jgi:hypothetical protein
MTFEEIFNEPGLYKSDSFTKGTCFKVDKEGFLLVLHHIDKNDFNPQTDRATVYKGLFDKKYTKVLNRNQLFE